MRFRSLTGRLVACVLCIEACLAVSVTAAALYYEHRETLRAFDVMLQGRADAVLGAVQDAEDAGDNVLLDKSSLNIPPQDIYEVREENGRFIGSSKHLQTDLSSTSTNEGGGWEKVVRDNGKARNLKIARNRYRAIVMHGLRLIDPDEPGTAAGGKGTLHHIVIYYAAPTRPVGEALWRAARFFLFADTFAILLSVAAAGIFIRRGLHPLGDLAAQASLLSPRSWVFHAPASAYQLDELAPLASALDIALQGLNRAYEQQRTFVNDAAHELKTAVTVLKSSLQLMTLRDRKKSEYMLGIEGCLSDCGRMEELVQRMLLLARVEQPAAPITRTPAETAAVAEVLQQVIAQLESAASLRHVTLVTEITDERRAILPEEDVSTLFGNLLMNAIQHSGAGTTIRARLTPIGDAQIQVEIADQGEGIAAEHLPRVFERFYRTDASRSRDTGGTGLGLAICKAIVESWGGTIQIASQPGSGTTVTAILAAAPRDAAPSESHVPLNEAVY